ncbi:MAG: 2Fe-2S iron-sulfur cluster-binding protein, partial [Flavobacteriaceae bacterium]
GGVCSSCIAKLKKGKIEMLENQILTDEEIKDGLVLTCQSIPASDNIIIDYDEV